MTPSIRHAFALSPVVSGRPRNLALWTLQILLGVFMAVASGAPKLFGDPTAVVMFDRIGLGDGFRYLVGVLEIAGGLGLLVPHASHLAALGLALVMVGAVVTSLTVLAAGALTITPAVLFVLFALIARVRWPR